MDLTRGGFFYKRSDGSYDTILSAQLILKSVSDNHDKQLATLKLQLQDSKDLLQSASSVPKGPKDSLGDLVSTGLSTDDNVSTGSMFDSIGGNICGANVQQDNLSKSSH